MRLQVLETPGHSPESISILVYDLEKDADAPHGLWTTLAWFAGLIGLTWLVGFILALAVFLLSFFRIRAQAGWPKTLILTAAGIALMCLMAALLNRDFPPGLLQDAVDLPWPLGSN